MTDKEKVFVWQYLVHHNATLAAKRAGYSERSAGQIGHETLKKHEISAAVEAGLGAIAERCQVNADRVVRELAAVGFSNINNFEINEGGDVALTAGAPPEAIAAGASIKRKKIVRGDGSVIFETEFRLVDKLQALMLLGKHLKLFTERLEVENVQDTLYKALLLSLKEGSKSN